MTVAMLEYTREQLDNSHAGIIERDGLKMFVSYNTVIGLQCDTPSAVYEFGDAPVFTSEKFSPTTTRHINRFREVYGGTKVGTGRFEEYRNRALLRADTLEAKEGF